MVNYQNAKIYKIISNQTEKIYVGSTVKYYLSARLAEHKQDYKRWVNKKLKYTLSSFEIIQYDDAKIILIENWPCNSKAELCAREQYWIDNIKYCCNKNLAFQPDKKRKLYFQNYEKTEKRKQYMKQYMQQYDKIKINCICGQQCSKHWFSQHLKKPIHINFINDNKEMAEILNLVLKSRLLDAKVQQQLDFINSH